MSKSSPVSPSRGKAAAAAKTGSGLPMGLWIGAAVGVIVVAAIVVALVSGSGKKTTSAGGTNTDSSSSGSSQPVTGATIMNKVSAVSTATINAVGAGSTDNFPTLVSGTKITQGGKPEIMYVGGEFCPFCAAERWAIANALSRFGTFSNVGLTHSSPDDVFPSTPTLSFYKSTYTSQYVVFTPKEVADGDRQPLDPLTKAQDNIWGELVGQNKTFPFIDFGGEVMLSNGSSYTPQVLQGMTQQQVADALNNPNSDVSKGAIGAANTLTAAICKITHDQPGPVCSQPAVAAIEKQLK